MPDFSLSLPALALYYLLFINLFAFILMGLDKRKAKRGGLAHPGTHPVPPCPAGRRRGRLSGHVDLSPQDQALVLPLRVSPDHLRGAGRCAVASVTLIPLK